jgi:flagellar biosynthesis/type III secretory pathway chaperone
MADKLSLLMDLLRQNEEAMQELQSVLRQEQQCIVGLDTDGLARAGRSRQEQEERVQACASACRDLIAELGRERGGAPVQSIQELAPLLEQERGVELLAAKERLQHAAGALQRLNAINQGLVSHTLETVQRSMALFGKIFSGGETYGSAGLITAGQGGGCLLCKDI